MDLRNIHPALQELRVADDSIPNDQLLRMDNLLRKFNEEITEAYDRLIDEGPKDGGEDYYLAILAGVGITVMKGFAETIAQSMLGALQDLDK